jgi:hypothetical protein
MSSDLFSGVDFLICDVLLRIWRDVIGGGRGGACLCGWLRSDGSWFTDRLRLDQFRISNAALIHQIPNGIQPLCPGLAKATPGYPCKYHQPRRGSVKLEFATCFPGENVVERKMRDVTTCTVEIPQCDHRGWWQPWHAGRAGKCVGRRRVLVSGSAMS